MQRVNDNPEGLRSKMADWGIPDFGIGTSINRAGNVNFNGSYRGQQVLNTENLPSFSFKSEQTALANIEIARQTSGEESWQSISGGGWYA
jgi:hypothetical protein